MPAEDFLTLSSVMDHESMHADVGDGQGIWNIIFGVEMIMYLSGKLSSVL